MLATITFTDILDGSAIPLLTLIIAAVPLIDSLRASGNADPRARRLVTIVMMTALVVLFVVQSASSVKDNDANMALRDIVTDQSSALKSQGQLLDRVNVNVDKSVASLQAIELRLRSYGVSPAIQDTISRSLTAHTYVANLNRSTLSKDVKIVYFPKDVDGTKVITNLRNLGYVVTTGVSNIRDEPTNAIWAGDDVNIADVKAIAQTLMQAGVLFRSLERFCHPTPGKTIQIGADDFANDRPAYTSAQIHDLRAPLPRDCSGQESP